MKTFLGFLFLVGGVVLGLWLGLYVMFIGGIAQMINSFNDFPKVDGWMFAFGMAKFWLSGLVGWLSFMICTFIANFLAND